MTSHSCLPEIEILGEQRARQFLTRIKPPSSASFFDQLEGDIRAFIRRLESIRDQLSESEDVHEGEEKLRTRIVHNLQSMGYEASAETHESGHADILVRVPDDDGFWIGECKVHTQYSFHKKGLAQLHTRYHSGRCPRSGFIIFCFRPKSSTILSKWRDLVFRESLCGLAGTPSEIVKMEFTSEHISNVTGLAVQTRHYIASLYYAPEA